MPVIPVVIIMTPAGAGPRAPDPACGMCGAGSRDLERALAIAHSGFWVQVNGSGMAVATRARTGERDGVACASADSYILYIGRRRRRGVAPPLRKLGASGNH